MKTERAPKQKVPESGVLKACLDVLGYAHIWHERRNTVPVLVDDGRGGKRPIKVAEKGTPDIMATPRTLLINDRDEFGEPGRVRHIDGPPCVLWIECKSDSGKQTPEQIEFQRRAEEAGHCYLLVRDVDTLRNWLRENGVIR